MGALVTTPDQEPMITTKLGYVLVLSVIAVAGAHADSSTLDAAIGGGIGGATGAAVGNEIGGRDGAIIGGALGAAVGTAVTTDDEPHRPAPPAVRYEYAPPPVVYPPGYHCPPGQRKKGRC